MSDLTPGSPEWVRRVSPSKAAAILGLSPWDSPYSIWMKMKGIVPWDEESPAMERGTLCEPAVLAYWRKHHPGHTDYREQVTQTIGDWCVGTPDALAVVDGNPVLIEAKTSTSDWDDEVPDHYRVQVDLAMHICHLNGIPVTEAHVVVLGGRRMLFDSHVLPYVPEYGAAILAKLKAFHDSLDADVAPDLDDSVATWEAVRRVHPDIDTGAEVELDASAAVELARSVAAQKTAEAAARLGKSTALNAMGRAQYLTHNGVRLARRQPRGDAVTFVVLAKPSDLTQESAA